MGEKLCIFCKHFNWNQFEMDYGSGSMGDYFTGGMECFKGHYHRENPGSNEEFRSLILLAENCPDYERPIEGQCREMKP